ncbi:MAG: hypothetical protein B7733_21780 [Myxococcales bacterium FL481]|nr:MAG: hypothetical protein B7733_21780 [Myxococcales bacterium FL481]
MLAEVWQYLTTPCPSHARRTGHLHETIALEARAKRCRRAWRDHVRACHATILDAVATCDRRRHVMVLGSGPLTDLPIDRLMERFDRIDLVDIVHPLRIVRRFSGDRRVRLHRLDLSGTLAPLVQSNRRAPLPEPSSQLPVLTDRAPDLVISLNLLSQLAILPVRYACRVHKVTETLALPWAQAIVRAHLHALASTPSCVCLITDVRAEYRDRQQRVELSDDLLYGQALPTPARTWPWLVAPRGELRRGESVQHQVWSWPRLPKAELESLLQQPCVTHRVHATVHAAKRHHAAHR